MNIAVIGLGKMGSAIAHRLCDAGFIVSGFDPHIQLEQDSRLTIAHTVQEAVQSAHLCWLMVPVGDPVDQVLREIMPHLMPDTIIVDGGNSYYVDSQRRAEQCAQRTIAYLDCGTSGGIKGIEQGFALMIGGDIHAYVMIEPVLKAIAAPHGYGHVGPSGAGHYVKMVHNGIEYALLQAYAEGFQLIKEGSFKKEDLDLAKITHIWQHGSVIRSWLLELAHDIFKRDQTCNDISGEIAEGGTGKWSVEDAQKHHIPVPTMEASLKVRAWSRISGGNYATKIIALLRHAFGGHAVKKVKS